jgi:hypothetical protein
MDGYTFEIHFVGEFNDILTIALVCDGELMEIYAGPSWELWEKVENLLDRFGFD